MCINNRKEKGKNEQRRNISGMKKEGMRNRIRTTDLRLYISDQDDNKKKCKVFFLLLAEGTFTSFFKDNKL
jgi:hypothetical protein